ncbi:hypothetical protein [Marinobacterium mangrovicola]|uniref:Uncharacterized protein n=1 Tax=Marinobacterium mangrovicola TaxID=1476959 RepID=A0A4R1GK32_9GAMM|nr:hypothetical protein [Marinobacterium mangrovicola]TCK07245.1 hypothetical protein CLV83_2104 [Marinobacterium mangrovicola]
MTVTLGVSLYSNWQIISPLLETLGCAPVKDAYPESWYLEQQGVPEGFLLLAYTYPEKALVCAMQKGQEPAKALQDWERHIQALLTLYKKNRNRAVLVNIQQAANNRERTVEAIASNWNLNIALPDIKDKNDDSEPDSYFRLIATYIVQQDRKLNGLLAQLEACTLPVNSEDSERIQELDIDSLFWDISKLRQRNSEFEALKVSRDKAEGELKQCIEDMHELRTALESKDLDYQQKDYEAQRLQQELEQARRQSQQLQSGLGEENLMVIEQLHRVQEELAQVQGLDIDSVYREVSKLRQRDSEFEALKVAQAKADEELKQRIEDVNKLRTSLEAKELEYQQKDDEAQRLQQQLEQTRQQSQQLQSALGEENQLVIEHLHRVQEELAQVQGQDIDSVYREVSNLRQRDEKLEVLKAAQAKSDEERERRVADVNKLRASLEATEFKYRKAHDEVRRLNQELEHVGQQGEQVQSALREENRLVIEHLHQVQEELERQFIHKHSLEKQLKRLTLEQEQALSAANNQISRLQNELNRIKGSVAWKATTPMRAISHSFIRTSHEKSKLKKQVEQLESTKYFDAAWYLKTYPDVAASELTPVEHYLKFGADEGRNPSPEFDTHWYVQVNPDVQESGINPLIHFISHGQGEGRAPNSRVQQSLPSPQEEK